ncbi:MAG TPA: ADP-ribosylglycohydrolase family protein [Ornithinibacter sp.]|nr:ADP-ribosylglycohydrolase family protein [Ornithinibacter sp.]
MLTTTVPEAPMHLTPAQADRAAGVLLTQAVGDAIGVPYEFAAPPPGEPEMIGGGLGDLAPGEWSDDTQMAICIARVAATGADLTSTTALDAVAAAFEGWLTGGASDVGTQTRAVLEAAARATGPAGSRLTTAARDHAASNAHSAGNGALMRTSIVGLTRLHDRAHTAASARAVAALTHADPLALDSCVLWSDAVRRAVLSGHLDVAAGLVLIDSERRDQWGAWVADATGADPARFVPNGFTVTALQAAWAAITSTDLGDGSPLHVRRALTAAVHAGDDTDTVAAIAGGLLGARYGASAVPTEWASAVHGWPGMRAQDLTYLADRTCRAGCLTAGERP